MYQLAEELIGEGKAYVDHLSDEEIREYRGSLAEPGRPSPYRERTVEENLALFREMRAGDLPDGSCVLRAKIDLERAQHEDARPASLPDPPRPPSPNGRRLADLPDVRLGPSPLRRHRGCHPLALHPGVRKQPRAVRLGYRQHTRLGTPRVQPAPPVRVRPAQPRLHRLEQAQAAGAGGRGPRCDGWDDPRMPTIAAMRRRGISPEAIRAFADLVGVAKVNSTVDIDKLEFCVRDDLNWTAPRVMGVLRPLKVTITSWPEGRVEDMTGPYFPPDVGKPGERTIPLERQILIERDDFVGRPAARLSATRPGPDGPSALRPLHHLRRRRHRRGRGRRSPLPSRPRLGREEPGRRQGLGRHPLGAGRPDRCRPKSASTTACSWTPDPEDGVRRRAQPRLGGGGARRPPRAEPGGCRAGKLAGSSNGSVTSCSTRRTPNPMRRS